MDECEKCGSRNVESHYLWDDNMDDEVLLGFYCQDCGHYKKV